MNDENFDPKAACSASIEAELSSTKSMSTLPPGPLEIKVSYPEAADKLKDLESDPVLPTESVCDATRFLAPFAPANVMVVENAPEVQVVVPGVVISPDSETIRPLSQVPAIEIEPAVDVPSIGLVIFIAGAVESFSKFLLSLAELPTESV